MDLRRTLVRCVATASVAAATLGLAGPASAQSVTVHDGADTTASLSDIRTVTVRHLTDRVVVRATFTDLVRDTPAGIRINIDTRADRTGPEFALLSGLGEGTDYQLLRVRDWRPVGEPLTCAHRATIDWSTDVFRLVAGRGCLGSPARVRVAMWMRDTTDGSHPVTDHLLGVRRFTPWVARG